MVMLSDTVHDITPTVSRRPDRKASRASLESNIFDLISSEFKTVAESGQMGLRSQNGVDDQGGLSGEVASEWC
eukprot:7161042-Prymnesium_polylepis.1